MVTRKSEHVTAYSTIIFLIQKSCGAPRSLASSGAGDGSILKGLGDP